MQTPQLYKKGHLVVSAIRILEYQKGSPPSIEKISEFLSLSLEQVNFLCKKLSDMGIIEIMEGAFGSRLFILNHLALEDIPKEESQKESLKDAIKEYQNTRKGMEQKIADIQSKQAEKQKSLFAELDKKLKKGLDKS